MKNTKLSLRIELSSGKLQVSAQLGKSKYQPPAAEVPDELASLLSAFTQWMLSEGIPTDTIAATLVRVSEVAEGDSTEGFGVKVSIGSTGVSILGHCDDELFQADDICDETQALRVIDDLRAWTDKLTGGGITGVDYDQITKGVLNGLDEFWDQVKRGEFKKDLRQSLGGMVGAMMADSELRRLRSEAECRDNMRRTNKRCDEEYAKFHGLSAEQNSVIDRAFDSPKPVSPKEAVIKRIKELRVAIDEVLQDVKALGKDCLAHPCIDNPHADGFEFFLDPSEVPANLKLSQRHLEDAVMRLGMTLKAVGTPTPYPNSYNPNNSAVEPTADGLKL